ncbi:DUF4374 domain-containing protein [Tenacibaculum ovolyticum]|uniref:DUF4374 domain-containing protein n=1 Tax=Tenacibaculum ovolyticum TaxID=104270 RepID=UPI0007ED3B24|nr:DUF4374 domain-containing protein [Tenacibaculum ovolyticum]
MKQSILSIGLLLTMSFFVSCSADTPVKQPKSDTKLAVAVQVGEKTEATNVVLGVENFMESVISPINNGIQQDGKRNYYFVNNTIISSGYKTTNCIGYDIKDGKLTKKGEFAFPASFDLLGKGDDKTMIAVESPRAGFENRTIFLVDTDNLVITKELATKIDERQDENLMSWPTGIAVKGGKLFLSYYLTSATGDAWKTPNSNEARIAVYSYPELIFEKLIKDTRGSDIGFYGNYNGLVKDENNNIYTASTSSSACGFDPAPANKSAILKIKSGDTDFDKDYYFDFETISGGNKINFLHYVGNNKAVVRMITDDSKKWDAFAPVGKTPICKIAIVDLEAKTVKEVTDIPLHGGQWATPALNHNGKVYMNISDNNGAYIYEIDVNTATAKKSQQVEAAVVKGIFAMN